MNEQDQLIQINEQLVYNLQMALEWLNSLEKCVGINMLLWAMPNNWGGRNAIKAAIEHATEGDNNGPNNR